MTDTRNLPHRLSAHTPEERKTQQNLDKLNQWVREIIRKIAELEARITAGGL